MATGAVWKKVKVVAVCDFDPSQNYDSIVTQEQLKDAPDGQTLLSFNKGQCFEILTKKIKSCWLYVKCVSFENEGFIPSMCVVPLKEELENETYVCLKFLIFTNPKLKVAQLKEAICFSHFRLHFLMNGGDLSPSMVNQQQDCRFFAKPTYTSTAATSRKPESRRVSCEMTIIEYS